MEKTHQIEQNYIMEKKHPQERKQLQETWNLQTHQYQKNINHNRKHFEREKRKHTNKNYEDLIEDLDRAQDAAQKDMMRYQNAEKVSQDVTFKAEEVQMTEMHQLQLQMLALRLQKSLAQTKKKQDKELLFARFSIAKDVLHLEGKDTQLALENLEKEYEDDVKAVEALTTQKLSVIKGDIASVQTHLGAIRSNTMF